MPAKPATVPYTVLARRYRSRDFHELIGQEPIARTLQSAIKTGRTAHAYLFCGTRGVGKTSMARIFARALNATDDLREKDAIGEAILRGDDLDVIEIDAASNRGIDNARDLIAGASLSPARSPYKIYIIDEVHMLTREAFNALLKTMEEPPAHVKFILCTTESHKVPATIQSRCQRFDFRPIPSAKIAEQLRCILKNENIEADEEVVAQVARLGNGSMRDALSLMDRLLASGERRLTVELLEQMLGLPDHELITGLVDAFIAGDAAAALERGGKLLASGTSIEQGIELLTDHLRALMVIAACGGQADELLELTEERGQVAANQAQSFDPPALVHMIALCDAAARSARTSAAARAVFDALMVRLSMSQHFADIPALLRGDRGPGQRQSERLQQARGPAPPRTPTAEPKKKEAPVAAEAEIVIGRDGTLAGPPLRPAAEPHGTLLESKPDQEPASVPDAEVWSRVVAVASAGTGIERNLVRNLTCESFDGRVLRLSLNEGAADMARFVRSSGEKLAELVKRATSRAVRVEVDTSRCAGPASKPAGESSVGDYPPLVKRAMELFDASVIRVEEAESSKRGSADV